MSLLGANNYLKKVPVSKYSYGGFVFEWNKLKKNIDKNPTAGLNFLCLQWGWTMLFSHLAVVGLSEVSDLPNAFCVREIYK
jgi:hypothetical protein